jgi:hypothetical protein
LRKVHQVAVELKLTAMEGVAESGDELSAEDTAEHADGQEEGRPGGDPTGAIWCEATGCNYAVDVRMKLQALLPAMQHTEETDLGSKMAWIPVERNWRFASLRYRSLGSSSWRTRMDGE